MVGIYVLYNSLLTGHEDYKFIQRVLNAYNIYMNYLQVEKWAVVVQLGIDRTVARVGGGCSVSYIPALGIDQTAGKEAEGYSVKYIPA